MYIRALRPLMRALALLTLLLVALPEDAFAQRGSSRSGGSSRSSGGSVGSSTGGRSIGGSSPRSIGSSSPRSSGSSSSRSSGSSRSAGFTWSGGSSRSSGSSSRPSSSGSIVIRPPSSSSGSTVYRTSPSVGSSYSSGRSSSGIPSSRDLPSSASSSRPAGTSTYGSRFPSIDSARTSSPSAGTSLGATSGSGGVRFTGSDSQWFTGSSVAVDLNRATQPRIRFPQSYAEHVSRTTGGTSSAALGTGVEHVDRYRGILGSTARPTGTTGTPTDLRFSKGGRDVSSILDRYRGNSGTTTPVVSPERMREAGATPERIRANGPAYAAGPGKRAPSPGRSPAQDLDAKAASADRTDGGVGGIQTTRPATGLSRAYAGGDSPSALGAQAGAGRSSASAIDGGATSPVGRTGDGPLAAGSGSRLRYGFDGSAPGAGDPGGGYGDGHDSDFYDKPDSYGFGAFGLYGNGYGVGMSYGYGGYYGNGCNVWGSYWNSPFCYWWPWNYGWPYYYCSYYPYYYGYKSFYYPSLMYGGAVYVVDDDEPDVIYVEDDGPDVIYVEIAPNQGAGEVIVQQPLADPAPAGGELIVPLPAGEQGGALNSAAQRFLELGDAAFQDGRFGDAVQFYAKSIELAPETGVLYLVLSDALFATGDYHYAAYCVRRALEMDASLVQAVVDKHTFYRDPLDFDRQLATLEEYVEDHPTDGDAILVLAANYLFGGRPAEAVDLLEGPWSSSLLADGAGPMILAAARAQQFGAPQGPVEFE